MSLVPLLRWVVAALLIAPRLREPWRSYVIMLGSALTIVIATGALGMLIHENKLLLLFFAGVGMVSLVGSAAKAICAESVVDTLGVGALFCAGIAALVGAVQMLIAAAKWLEALP